jgi:hypothetical protein
MIQGTKLRDALRAQVRNLEADLRERFKSHEDYGEGLRADWRAATSAGRTAEALEIWIEGQFTQSAVAWVLACVFVRFCEDNGLLDGPLISGTDESGKSADQRQQAFYLRNPTASDNDYLRDVFESAARLPGLADVLRVQMSALAAPVSVDMAKQLLRFFRTTNADSGRPVHDFTDPEWNTRFLGDIYEELSEAARDRYALRQTPKFVEDFILQRTLIPALDIYTLEEVDAIDPTCGSGHFLLGAFDLLAPRWLRQLPGNANQAIQEALNRIAGIDLNPYAVAIARFRLLVAALKVAKVNKLRLAPDFHLRVETGDSLLHGFDQRDYRKAQPALQLNQPQENFKVGAPHRYAHAFSAENLDATNAILDHQYAVVVGNPPYITVKDRSVSKLYRERYLSCGGKYALVSPFCERFWALAKASDQTGRAGFVGLIVGNNFMKRNFGKRLVEAFFPTVDLTHVLDTAGAYIPGHGTPTAILFGRNRPPATASIRTVMGIEGEPGKPEDPAKGIVWSAILNQIDRKDSESPWVSVCDMSRASLSKHPWSIGGGGAAELKETMEEATSLRLGSVAESIGITSFTLEDGAYIHDASVCARLGIERSITRSMVVGDEVRDWVNSCDSVALFPYGDDFGPVDISSYPIAHRFLWPFRTSLSNSKMFAGETKVESGLRWYEYGRLTASKLQTPLSITFAFVATHNHFVLDRGGKVFNRSSPVIKLPSTSTEDEHLGLLGLLNSSAACFWLKQVFHNKGSTVDQHGARQRTSAFEDFYEFAATGIAKFPVPTEKLTLLARRLDAMAAERDRVSPMRLLSSGVPERSALDAARDVWEGIQRQMIAVQEELDWESYRLYGVLVDDLTYSGELPELSLGERAFEVDLARRCAAGQASTTWFERHGSLPVTSLPLSWPEDYRALVERRLDFIRRSRDVALMERPEFKRRWAGQSWASLERIAIETWLLSRLEGADLWPRDLQSPPRLRSVRELVDALSGDEQFRRAVDLYAGVGADGLAIVTTLVQQASVPYLDSMCYSEAGLRKRAIWRQVWDLQRREDVIDAEESRSRVGQPAELIAKHQALRKEREVGVVPVPPKYKQDDFRDSASWKLRGALDVPSERFVHFPGLGRAMDTGSPLLIWAGYDAKARALALTGYLYELQQREGADPSRLVPAFAGLDEMLPWVHQWHPEVDDDLGMSTGDYLQGLLDAQLAQHGLTITEVRGWMPPSSIRRTRGRRSTAA